MVSALISRVIILVFGTLYPAYSSYKAVKTKNVKEYVKWMMYWIVFALFTTVETFADVLVSWFPFYYELKIVFVIWLLSPATKGSSVLYRKFVHPELLKREQEIDFTLERMKNQGYTALVNVGQQGLNYAVQSAVTGQHKMMDHLMKKSFSLGDLSRERGDSTQVSYRPSTERIAEDRDEPDVGQGQSDSPMPGVEQGQVQGGYGGSGQAHVPGYNLRSHEYHGEKAREPAAPHYKYEEGYHYGTLPRRSASMRSNLNAPLHSRYAKPTH